MKLAVFDIDRFRMINDTYGRNEGDAVIAEVAQRLRDTVDEADTVARITSNTFAIALSDDWDAAEIGHRLDELGELPSQRSVSRELSATEASDLVGEVTSVADEARKLGAPVELWITEIGWPSRRPVKPSMPRTSLKQTASSSRFSAM